MIVNFNGNFYDTADRTTPSWIYDEKYSDVKSPRESILSFIRYYFFA